MLFRPPLTMLLSVKLVWWPSSSAVARPSAAATATMSLGATSTRVRLSPASSSSHPSGGLNTKLGLPAGPLIWRAMGTSAPPMA
jgi:hypothetical protein